MRVRRLIFTFAILDTILLAVFLILFFTVFRAPTYVPFVSGRVSTLVPEGASSSRREGPWEKHSFEGKGTLVVRIRRVAEFDLGEVVRRNLDEAPAAEAPDAETFDLSDMVKRTRGDSTVMQTGRREHGASGGAPPGGRPGGPAAAMPLDDEETLRMEAGRTYIQLLATNTPNLRVMEDVPAFDSTIFCLGSVGREDRRYRYLVHAGNSIVDLHMHSPHSNHLVYKETLDKALLNLRIDGEGSNQLLAHALAELSGRISPRWSQGNIFWLVLFVALPTGIMLVILTVFMLTRRTSGVAQGTPRR